MPLSARVEQAKADPVLHAGRQATEILLYAIGIEPKLRDTLVLKGGILMSLAHGSHRQTGDVDFSAIVAPERFAGQLRVMLDAALPAAAAALGYVDTVCAVSGSITSRDHKASPRRPPPRSPSRLAMPSVAHRTSAASRTDDRPAS